MPKAFDHIPNGTNHRILNIADTRLDNTRIFTVPDGHFFVVSDNRDNAIDSRMAVVSGGFGLVPFENIVGKAEFVLFSSYGQSYLTPWTWRSDRFLTKIE